jgi:tetratricopeptide (TPR) repeat protein
MISQSWLESSSKIDLAIKNGKISFARQILLEVSSSKLLRNEQVEYANLCRRVGWPDRAIKVLRPYVYPENSLSSVVGQEHCSYAACLVLIGARPEAMNLLKPWIRQKLPEAFLQMSFIYMQEWNYRSAAYYLRRYIRFQVEGSYAYWVGMMNLASCYVVLGQYVKAKILCHQIENVALENQYQFLRHQVVRLQIQIYIHSGDFENANLKIEKIRLQKDPIDSISDLLLEKWRWILLGKRDGISSNHVQRYIELKRLSERWGHWESLRDLDFYQSLFTQDLQLLSRVYHGSPSKAYRQKILNEASFSNPFHAKDFTQISKVFADNIHTYQLNAPTMILRLLRMLGKDRYKKFSFGEIFAEVYTNEYYHPINSLKKMDRLIQRARKFLNNACPYLKIEVKGNKVWLISSQQGWWQIEQSDQSQYEKILLNSIPKGKSFTCKQLQQLTGIPRSSLFKIILNWRNQGRISSVGSRRDGRYILSAGRFKFNVS